MKYNDITKPIGLIDFCSEITSVCDKAHIYKNCGLKPDHLIVPMDSGCGRTTILEYMTDMYKQYGILNFSGGLDDYIEVTFDGTPQQLRQVFADIDSAAVYSNFYSNIVGMDISNIAPHINETQFADFLINIKKVCDHACVVFFVHFVPNRNEERLIEKLCDSIENIRRLNIEPYTNDEICSLVMKKIDEHGISIDHKQTFRSVLSDIVTEFSVLSVKDAILVADTLVHYADFSGFTPVVDENNLKTMIASWQNDVKRRDAK